MKTNADAVPATARPIHPVIIPLAAGLFLATLVTDLLFLKTLNMMWASFSIWLLTGGLIIAGIAGLALLFDLFAWRRSLRPAWLPLIATVVAALLALVNAFIHSRDVYTAVAGSGITLSVIVSLIIVYMAFNRWTLMAPRTAPSNRR
jgi:uncharacterized membrane protein